MTAESPNWVPVSQLLINTAQPGFQPSNPMRFGLNDAGAGDWGNQTVGKWVTVDMTQWGVPANALAVLLTGLLIITHGTTVEDADIMIGFRASGDPNALASQYAIQLSLRLFSCTANITVILVLAGLGKAIKPISLLVPVLLPGII